MMNPEIDDRAALESPSLTDLRVIGVELAVTRRDNMNGTQREQELEMFSCKHTIPAVVGPARRYNGRDPLANASFRVTLHTSQGDLTAYLSSEGGGRVSAQQIF